MGIYRLSTAPRSRSISSGIGLNISRASSPAPISFGSRRNKVQPGNPDPYHFVLVKSVKAGDYWVSLVKYPNCKNYEGKKVLVTRKNPRDFKILDPHFTDEHNINAGLLARFEPTDFGWRIAVDFAEKIS